jgi:hypothetical protein
VGAGSVDGAVDVIMSRSVGASVRGAPASALAHDLLLFVVSMATPVVFAPQRWGWTPCLHPIACA